MKNYSLGFLFNENRSGVILIRKEKPEWQRGKFNGVGGKIEPNETPYDCMCREFLEETGVVYKDWIEFFQLEGSWGSVHIFKGFNDLAFESAKTVEIEQIVKIPLHMAPWDNMIPNLQWIIRMALDKDDIRGSAFEHSGSLV